MTSLICIFVMSNTPICSLLGSIDRSDETKNGFYPSKKFADDLPDLTTRMTSIERAKRLKIVGEKADVPGSRFNPSKELDFAIIGWPKTGKEKTNLCVSYFSSLWKVTRLLISTSRSCPFLIRNNISPSYTGRAPRNYHARKRGVRRYYSEGRELITIVDGEAREVAAIVDR